jgi:hypothetical protein
LYRLGRAWWWHRRQTANLKFEEGLDKGQLETLLAAGFIRVRSLFPGFRLPRYEAIVRYGVLEIPQHHVAHVFLEATAFSMLETISINTGRVH